jgi:hypothetical protein
MTNGTIRRTARGWVALSLRVLALVFLTAALIVHGDFRLLPIAAVLGCILVIFVLRDRGPAATGAAWSGSADLLKEGRKFSGQLSLADGRVVWSPSVRSRRDGLDEISMDITSESDLALETGPALLDVIVAVSVPAGNHQFLTHRGPALRRAIRRLSV